MGLFQRRKNQDTAPAESDTARSNATRQQDPSRERGPWDVSQAPSRTPERLDLGSLRIPPVTGMQIRLDAPGGGETFGSALVVLGGSTLELRAFAAPRTAGLWDELRADIAAELTRNGARYEEVQGEYGVELLAHHPARTPDGQDIVVPARFIGIDGPRWFLRGVLQGRAATEEQAAGALREVLRDVVVVRDSAARPPRELLALHAPGHATAPEAEDLPGLDPLRPGPTIAEVR